MTQRQQSQMVGAVSLGFVCLAGCMLRTEEIRIARDGGVAIELEISGTEEELAGPDAMPSARSGWLVKRRIEQDKDGEKLTLTSTREFSPGEPLPRTFGGPSDPRSDWYLDFPTEVRVERRADGIYYFFRRTYTPRPWAYIQHWQDVIFDEETKNLGAKPVEELTRDERRAIIRAFAMVEARKQLEFAEAALEDSLPGIAVEDRLIARQALLDVYDEYGLLVPKNKLNILDQNSEEIDEVIERCDSLADEEQSSCYDDAAEQLLNEAYEAFAESLRRGARVGRRAVEAFASSYERARLHHEITGALGAQHFEVAVVMPGTIIAHNADDIEVGEDERAGMSSAFWHFDGRAFRDRTQTLIAVSRLTPAEEAKRWGTANDDDR